MNIPDPITKLHPTWKEVIDDDGSDLTGVSRTNLENRTVLASKVSGQECLWGANNGVEDLGMTQSCSVSKKPIQRKM